jgi:hypothetical protein
MFEKSIPLSAHRVRDQGENSQKPASQNGLQSRSRHSVSLAKSAPGSSTEDAASRRSVTETRLSVLRQGNPHQPAAD